VASNRASAHAVASPNSSCLNSSSPSTPQYLLSKALANHTSFLAHLLRHLCVDERGLDTHNVNSAGRCEEAERGVGVECVDEGVYAIRKPCLQGQHCWQESQVHTATQLKGDRRGWHARFFPTHDPSLYRTWSESQLPSPGSFNESVIPTKDNSEERRMLPVIFRRGHVR
jgi:hypothetical protein